MIKFSLLGETILEWNDKDIEHYHARRMAMDSMLCRFKATYPAERIDSVRSLLEDKERQMFQIVRLMDEQQSINKKIANQIRVIKKCRNSPKSQNEKVSWASLAKKRERSQRQQRLRSVHPIETWSTNRMRRAVDCQNKPIVLLPVMQNLTDNCRGLIFSKKEK